MPGLFELVKFIQEVRPYVIDFSPEKPGNNIENETISENNNKIKFKPDWDMGSMEDTEEFRLLMAYAQRRLPKKEPNGQMQPSLVASNGSVDPNPTPPSKTEIKTEKKKAKNKVGRRLQRFFRCIKPQTEEAEGAADHDVNDRCFVSDDVSRKDKDEMKDIADRVIGISDEIEFVPSDMEVEEDNLEDDVEKIVGLMLREKGDQLYERFRQENISLELFSEYSFFRRVVEVFLEKIGFRSSDPEALGPQASPKTQIAVTCEITSRLSVLDTRATNRFLNNGARFLQDYYSTWAQKHGGYGAVFEKDDEEID